MTIRVRLTYEDDAALPDDGNLVVILHGHASAKIMGDRGIEGALVLDPLAIWPSQR